MDLSAVKEVFAANGCLKIYAKTLAANDNSKNQVYLGGNFEVVNILPIGTIQTAAAGNWARQRFKAALAFSWIGEDGGLVPAPNAQLILYPKYPEVRFSGFLRGCADPPSTLMKQRLPGRVLLFAVTPNRSVLGYVTSPHSNLAKEFRQLRLEVSQGVFSVIDLPAAVDNTAKLLTQLRRITKLGWIGSRRLNGRGESLPCLAPNCGGYTLEAELGITPNGYSEPDFYGWEVKQYAVNDLNRPGNSTITLMTPEPTCGYYTTAGVEAFIHKYGYDDKRGRADRKNFGGVHRVGETHETTQLTLVLDGYDAKSRKIKNAGGMIALLDAKGEVAAGWSFASLLQHWNRKHNQACYVPSIRREKEGGGREYCFGSAVMLATGTSFELFLQQMAEGHIVYDPGIKLVGFSSGTPVTKRRSQFRIRSVHLPLLYRVVTHP